MCSCVLPSLFLLGTLLVAAVAAPAGPDGQPLAGAGSLDGSGSTAGGPSPYDLKSTENPHWNSFLNEVASQTSWTLADLTAKGASDPSIGLMWDVYVHSLGDGAALPGTSSSSGSGTSSSSSSLSSSSTASAAPSSTNAELPNVNQNWFQSFFTNPADSTANSYSSQTQTQYDTGLSTNSFGGSTGGSAYSQFGSAPSSSGSMDQMFSRFRLPSSSGQTQTQTQYQQTQQYQPNSMALAQQFYSLVSPSLLQSLTPQQTQQTQQSVPQVRLPDAGWGMEQQPPTTVSPPPLSDMALQQLGDELLRLLGKSGTPPPPTPPPVPVTTPAPQPDQPRFDLTNFTNSLAQSLTQSLSQSQTQPQPQPPPAPVAQTQTQTNTQMQAGGQIPSPSQMPAGSMLGTDLLNMPSNNVQIPADFGAAGMGLPPGNMPFPSLPPRSPLDPMINLYNARFKAGASRDLGCRTLGEMLDMDVPRPLNLNCPQLCPAVLGRAMTGKRFGLTCLCCPVYVSDQAIGFRSMQRQAESLA